MTDIEIKEIFKDAIMELLEDRSSEELRIIYNFLLGFTKEG